MPRVELDGSFAKKAQAQAGADRTIFWDTRMPGFGLVVTGSGHKSFVYQYRAGGSSRRMNLDGKFLRVEAEREALSNGKTRPVRKPTTPLEAARREAVKVQGALLDGRDPLTECRNAVAGNTFRAVAMEYLADPEGGKRLRSRHERERIFKVYLYPRFGSRQIGSIRRSEISDLLRKIRTERGPVMADHVLALLRKLLNWHAADNEDFRSPIVRGMSKTKPRERARDRKLEDHELRAIWKAAEGLPAPYGYLCRFLLLTATRLREGAHMAHSELSGGSEWLIPAKRSKTKRPFLVPLSKAAQGLLAQSPAIGQTWIFSFDGKKPINSFSKGKALLDARVLEVLREKDPNAKQLERWTWHDLRRTARSLMSRAGVQPDHAERCLGHSIPGVRAVYDHHEYVEEKRAAFEALAHLIANILMPATDKVVQLRAVR